MSKKQAVLIRQATPGDAADMARVHVASWRAAYKGIVPDSVLDKLDVDARAQAWEKILTQTEFPCYIITDEEDITGFVHLSRSRDPDKNPDEVAEITAMYLGPDHYRQGYGTILMDHAMKTLAGHGFVEVDLWVLQANDAARLFYEKLGFTEEGSSKFLERLAQQEIRYTKAIISQVS